MTVALLLALGLVLGQVQQPAPKQQYNTDADLPQFVLDQCVKLEDGTQFFYGPDGAVGEGDTCIDAIVDWHHEAPPKGRTLYTIRLDTPRHMSYKGQDGNH